MAEAQYAYALKQPPATKLQIGGEVFQAQDIVGTVLSPPKPRNPAQAQQVPLMQQFKAQGLNTAWYDKSKKERRT